MMKLWKVSNGTLTDYIRSESLDDSKKIFDEKYPYDKKAVSFQVVDYSVNAVYFSDSTYPAYFKGTKTEARQGARLYIKQWQLNATIERIETL